MADPAAVFNADDLSSPLSVPPSETALLLLDFHGFIVSMIPSESQQAVTTTASGLRQWARDQGMTVIHCLIDCQGKPDPRIRMAKRCNEIQTAMKKAGQNAYAEVPELTASSDEYIFWRPLGSISCFSSFGLTDFLEGRGIRSVILSGVATSGCVIDTAKAASERGLVVSVVEDACADREVEVHEVVTNKLLRRQCHVVKKDELIEAWKV